MKARSQPAPAETLARRFCLALADAAAGMQPGTWRTVDTIAHAMVVTFEEASAIADDCARRQWVDHELHSVRLREGGRRVAVDIRKTIISKQQSAEVELSTANWNARQISGQQMTDLEKLQHEIYLLGETINSNAAAVKSKTMSYEDREALKRQITVRTAQRNLLLQRLDRLSR
jgi:Rps23 Pro-64 3,4-dihydroxylase Tpa1-like proline 4-hydroxylase